MKSKDYILVGKHPSIDKIRHLISMVADSGFNVLITGETGTGKEVVARLLHTESPRSAKRFIKVNSGALPGTLLESELFGYEKGAFTGADQRKPGKFDLAEGGVMFLDEIGDMPMDLQVKMLEVLQSSTFYRLGGKKQVKTNAWVIASTNRDLESDVKNGRFREDLFYRLNVIRIEIVSLRERKEDIPLLIDHFVDLHRSLSHNNPPFSIPETLATLFQEYHWPGNVRELSNIVSRLFCGESPAEIRQDIIRTWMLQDKVSVEPSVELHGVKQERNAARVVPLKTLKAEAKKAIEIRAIDLALRVNHGCKSKAARMLGISYKTLYNKLDSLALKR